MGAEQVPGGQDKEGSKGLKSAARINDSEGGSRPPVSSKRSLEEQEWKDTQRVVG